MAKSVLGRGFDSLIPTDMVIGDVARPQEQVRKIPLEKIVRNTEQPRKEFDETALHELATSVKQHGVIQPIIVTPFNSKYRIVAGERRFRASQMAGQKDIPAIVRNHEELEELEISLVENVQRVDLSPLEQAVSIVRLHEQFNLSYKQIAKKLGKAETTISNTIRLLQLPEEARIALQKGQISEGHARALLALKHDPRVQLELLKEILEGQLSVRQAERIAQLKKSPESGKTIDTPLLNYQVKRIKKVFNGTHIKASIKQTKSGKFQLQLVLADNNALEEIIKILEQNK